MSVVDAVLLELLEVDLLAAESERPLPLPPKVPTFARETVPVPARAS